MKRKAILAVVVLVSLAAILAVFRVFRSVDGGALPAEVSVSRGKTAVGSRKDQGHVARGRLPVSDEIDFRRLPAAGSAGSGSGTNAAASTTHAGMDAIPGEHIVSFFDRRDRDQFVAMARAKGMKILGASDFRWSVRVKEGSAESWAALLREAPRVVDDSPNYYVRIPPPPFPKPVPPDEMPVPFGNGALRWMGVPRDNSAWGRGITVALLDSGVRDHPSLPGGVKRIDLLENGDVGTGGIHATAVASILGGRGGGLTGMAPSADLMSVRVIPDNGPGDVFTLVCGIVDAVDNGARVLNLSLGSRGDSYLLKDAVKYAIEKNAVLIAAMGNDGVETALYPAAYPGVLAVTAVDTDGTRAFFSNSYKDAGVAAPGMGLLAAAPKGQVGLFSGTSAAAPLVSGVAAMLLSANPGLSPSEVVNLVCTYSDDAGMPGRDSEYGSGVVNIQRLMNRQVPGIVDMAAGRPHVELPSTGNGDLVVHVYAQNRGTEVLPRVTLELLIEQTVRHVWSFQNVGVSQTVSHTLRTDFGPWRRLDRLVFRVNSSVEGARDVNPVNDSATVSVQVVDKSGAEK